MVNRVVETCEEREKEKLSHFDDSREIRREGRRHQVFHKGSTMDSTDTLSTQRK